MYQSWGRLVTLIQRLDQLGGGCGSHANGAANPKRVWAVFKCLGLICTKRNLCFQYLGFHDHTFNRAKLANYVISLGFHKQAYHGQAAEISCPGFHDKQQIACLCTVMCICTCMTFYLHAFSVFMYL